MKSNAPVTDQQYIEGWPDELSDYLADARGIVSSWIEQNEPLTEVAFEELAATVGEAFTTDLTRYLLLVYSGKIVKEAPIA